jgi:hypothetical protein
MSAPERCNCGSEDCPRCYPSLSRLLKPKTSQYETALESVVETVMDYGHYPANGRVQFDLYEFLLENRDPSYAHELYVASMSSNTRAFEDRIERERKTVTKMLEKHLKNSDIVANLAIEYLEEE